MINDILTESSSDYHSRKDFIGSSSLKSAKKSMAHFYAAWKGEALARTPAMEQGDFLHSLLLEQDIDKFIARPLNEKGELVRSNSKEYLTFIAENPGKTAIHPEDFNKAYEALNAFTKNHDAMSLIREARIETSVYATDHESSVKVKARPDIWGKGLIVDLKTSGRDFEISSFEKQIYFNQHDLQLAHYAETIHAATSELITDFYIIGFEQSAPFGSRVFKIKRKDIEDAKAYRRIKLNEISVCLEENKWPSYPSGIIEVSRPKFISIDNEINFGDAV